VISRKGIPCEVSASSAVLIFFIDPLIDAVDFRGVQSVSTSDKTTALSRVILLSSPEFNPRK